MMVKCWNFLSLLQSCLCPAQGFLCCGCARGWSPAECTGMRVIWIKSWDHWESKTFFFTSLSLDSTVPPMLCMAPLADAEWTSSATVTILSDFKDIVIFFYVQDSTKFEHSQNFAHVQDRVLFLLLLLVRILDPPGTTQGLNEKTKVDILQHFEDSRSKIDWSSIWKSGQGSWFNLAK